jgi:polyphosphate kinase
MKKKENTQTPPTDIFFDRDISWLSFNERVLQEAQRETVPLMERIRFLGIYSSNLDEFYRVRMPSIMALGGISRKSEIQNFKDRQQEVNARILAQQKQFGAVIKNDILGALRLHHIHLIYNAPIPEPIANALIDYFIHSVATYIQIVELANQTGFFPENNKLYLFVTCGVEEKTKRHFIVNIPSDVISRFYTLLHEGTQYIVFLDDIVKLNLPRIFGNEPTTSHTFKITRNAELDLQDEFTGNLARKIEKEIRERDLGVATRFLYEPGIPDNTLKRLKKLLGLKGANFIPGGAYHNLKDFSSLPLSDPKVSYEQWPKVDISISPRKGIFDVIKSSDLLLHPPYHSYDTVLRFFNEAAIDASVREVYVTLYRVASDSRIVNALISAAKNGKEVTVFVELKARFDEANNIKWSKKMKAAGVRIIESIPGLKVHAKLALVKRKVGKKTDRLGLIATGNFNENTARYYTDHILMTAHEGMLSEAEKLFKFLKKKKRHSPHKLTFDHLLVGQFNLQQRFIALIDREISNVKKGLSASITIKFNNLEDKVLISKLYEASNAGVTILLIVRGICCLVPQIPGMSENIFVIRIIDRYLEHGRVFIFNNNNDPEVYLGSADWMNRNIYRRIEVCFPVLDIKLKSEIIEMIGLQLRDNSQAVMIDSLCNNVAVSNGSVSENVRSQQQMSELLLRTR